MFAALLFALAAGSLEAVLMLRYFEPYITASTGEELFCFFSVDTVLPTVLYIVSAAAAAIIVIFGFIAQRRWNDWLSVSTRENLSCSMECGALL